MTEIIPTRASRFYDMNVMVELVTRSSSSSDSESSESDQCKHSDTGLCQRPVTSNVLTITVAVIIPSVVILSILGYFLFRNYRKDKKEAMEHDPDFDENGEATALPDFPSNPNFLQQNMYQIEDPFHNRNSVRYPVIQQGKGIYNKSSISLAPTAADPYLDTIVLPYQHQTGSKVSLDEYARQLGGDNSSYYHNTPSGSLSRTRNSSYSNLPIPTQNFNVSPQKSALRQQVSYIQKDDNEKTDYDTSSSSGSRSGSKEIEEKFTTEPQTSLKHDSYNTATSEPTPVGSSNHDEYDRSHEAKSPFEEDAGITTSNTTAQTVETKNKDLQHSLAPPAITVTDYEDNNNDDDDGDFDFTNSHENSAEDDSHINNSNSELLGSKPGKLTKSPRFSAFNLLKNDSDVEDDDHEEVSGISPEQEEEIKRMKSVYKVYFEGKEAKQQQDRFAADINEPLPELDQHDIVRINKELKMDTDYNKRMTVTSSLYGDTPIFTDEQEFQHQYPHQQQPYGYPVDGHYYNQAYIPNLQPAAQAYSQQQQQPPPQQYQHYQQQPPQQLPPLQKLKNASDFRKSTLETFTNFEPRMKGSNGQNVSPTTGRPFNPMEADGVWTSPVNSPHLQSQSSFSNPSNNTYYSTSPQLQPSQQQASTSSNPSASQLARSSVVMLNPVTEITKQRKFRPAGSVPGSGPGAGQGQFQGQGQGQGQYEEDFNTIESDLIPGNRKSDVRRMMNTNF
ncbi:uncharacterized protein RJT21DRAFT_52531 [Scheffersomyces amazonensis]|uniref:uncharacterized protein n=1 Tax=Scheffersomyces amazonensis TaxID=1078765 RepID=UPI00315DF6AC